MFWFKFKFYFLLFWGMVMYGNNFSKQKKIKFKPRVKLNHNIYIKVDDYDETRGINEQLLKVPMFDRL